MHFLINCNDYFLAWHSKRNWICLFSSNCFVTTRNNRICQKDYFVQVLFLLLIVGIIGWSPQERKLDMGCICFNSKTRKNERNAQKNWMLYIDCNVYKLQKSTNELNVLVLKLKKLNNVMFKRKVWFSVLGNKLKKSTKN